MALLASNYLKSSATQQFGSVAELSLWHIAEVSSCQTYQSVLVAVLKCQLYSSTAKMKHSVSTYHSLRLFLSNLHIKNCIVKSEVCIVFVFFVLGYSSKLLISTCKYIPSYNISECILESNQVRCCFCCRYSVMLQCWNHSPALRPSFFDIVFKLDSVLASSRNEVCSLV